jgi:hypothetical protein
VKATAFIAFCLTGFTSGSVLATEPVRKPTLWLALDDSGPSQMLRGELSRNWLCPNREVVLSRRQKSDLAVIGHSMNALRAQLFAQFTVEYVERDCVPLSAMGADGRIVRRYLPALRINHGRWESLDRRAFAFETRPLLTLDWYRARYAVLFDRDASPDALADYGCSEEGYSSATQVELPAPWELPVANTKSEFSLIPRP